MKIGIELLTGLYEHFDAGHEAAYLAEIAGRHQLRMKIQGSLVIVLLYVLNDVVQAGENTFTKLWKRV